MNEKLHDEIEACLQVHEAVEPSKLRRTLMTIFKVHGYAVVPTEPTEAQIRKLAQKLYGSVHDNADLRKAPRKQVGEWCRRAKVAYCHAITVAQAQEEDDG